MWHVADGLVVPALTWTDEFKRLPPPRVVPLLVLAALRTGDPASHQVAIKAENHRAVLRKLTVAVQRDIAGLSESEIAEVLSYSDESSVRRIARDGRALWCRLSAWPWWSMAPGALPAEWWREPAAVKTLRRWARPPTPRLRAPHLARPLTVAEYDAQSASVARHVRRIIGELEQ